ncbi:MAG: hypothetical protein HC929_09165 [Leptolyngbyaceae cyanobacterium SM2_5_2]|nr:hypothetical protein [Leptolyngbyaceae cyanobacterium SM2_5_2]
MANNSPLSLFTISRMIPKIFHRIWIGDSEIPLDYNKYWQKWKLLHPSWEFKDWGNRNIQELSLYSTIERVTSNAAKADIARYEIVYRFGGIYLDCDMDCYQPIDDLIDDSDEFIVCNQIDDFSCLCSIGFFASIPGHSILKHAIDEIVETDLELINSNSNVAEITGPYFFRRVINNRKVKKLNTCNFYPYFHLKSEWYQRNLDDVYGIHTWGGSWLPLESFIYLAKKQLKHGDSRSCLETCQKAKKLYGRELGKKNSFLLIILPFAARFRIFFSRLVFATFGQALILAAFWLYSCVIRGDTFSIRTKIFKKIYSFYHQFLTKIFKIFSFKTAEIQYNHFLDFAFYKKQFSPSISVLEIGAMDGRSFDKLYPYLKTSQNTKALFIEPLPDMQNDLKENYRGFKEQLNDFFFEESAVFDEEKQIIIHSISKEVVQSTNLPSWVAGISTLFPDKNAFSEEYNFEVQQSKDLRELSKQIVVCGIPLKKILNKYNFFNFDIVQIDVEGYDYQALGQVLDSLNPSIICFEWANLTSSEKKQAIKKNIGL